MGIFKYVKTQLNKLKIKTKLFIFMALPITLISFLGINKIDLHYQSYKQSQQGAEIVDTSLKLESLMVELQKERGLTEFYITASNDQAKEKVVSQRIRTNKAIRIFDLLTNKINNQINNISFLKDKQTIEIKLDKLHNLISELQTIRLHVDNQQSETSFQFYSKFIAKIIYLIESIQIEQSNLTQSHLTAASINLLWLIERSGQERGALNGILATKNLEVKKLQYVLNYISAQDEIIERFNSTAGKEQQNLLHSILTSKEHQAIVKVRNKVQKKIIRDPIISKIKSLIGFDGIIHHITNHNATSDKDFFEKITVKLVQLDLIINQLEEQYLINKEDEIAIKAIKILSSLFKNAITEHKTLHANNTKPPYLQFTEKDISLALEHLQRGELDISESHWWQLTTQRLEAIIDVNNQIKKQLIGNAKQLKEDSMTSLISYALMISLTIIFSLLISYLILKRVVGEISNIADFMKKTQKLHHFDEKITITGNDEISDMERAYNELLTERKQAEHLTRISAAVFEHASEAIFITNENNIIEDVNPAFTSITGYKAEEVIGKTPTMLKSGRHDASFYKTMWQSLVTTDTWQGEVWNRRKDGEIYPQFLAISAVKDHKNNVTQHIALFSDISKYKQYEQDIWHQANYDSLTQLPNRNLLSNRLEHQLNLMQRQKSQLAVLFIDLDHFKYVNDTYGHSFGDELIINVANKISQCIRKSDTIARLGGDEFIILLPNITELFFLEKLAKKILAEAAKPVSLSNGHQAIITASIGISVFPDDADNTETLLKNADTAMYRAKELGKNRYCFYTSEMNDAISHRVRLDIELREAILNQEFLLHYQPIIDTKTNSIASVEALIRWQHPEKGLTNPADFIKAAESTGLIVDIDKQILEQAAKDLAELHQLGYKIKMTVNISSLQCTSTSSPIALEISRVIKKFNIPFGFFNIEITESTLIDNTQHMHDTFEAIKALGVKIYMDDFGTGYSSLSYLKQFPIDFLKIDRSFIWKMLENSEDKNLVKAIIMIARSLKLKLVAEGVETKEHYNYLAELGCDFIQGYYLSRPLPMAKLHSFLENRNE